MAETNFQFSALSLKDQRICIITAVISIARSEPRGCGSGGWPIITRSCYVAPTGFQHWRAGSKAWLAGIEGACGRDHNKALRAPTPLNSCFPHLYIRTHSPSSHPLYRHLPNELVLVFFTKLDINRLPVLFALFAFDQVALVLAVHLHCEHQFDFYEPCRARCPSTDILTSTIEPALVSPVIQQLQRPRYMYAAATALSYVKTGTDLLKSSINSYASLSIYFALPYF